VFRMTRPVTLKETILTKPTLRDYRFAMECEERFFTAVTGGS
jgi:hypothetical protein